METTMATSVLIEDRLEIPLGISTLADFRRWAGSQGFPEVGRIDYVAGRIEVEMSPASLFTHGTLKVEIARGIANRVKQSDLGHVFSDRTRVSCPAAELSAEPDVVGFMTCWRRLDELNGAFLVPDYFGCAFFWGQLDL